MEFKKILEASKLIIVAGVLMVLIFLGISYGVGLGMKSSSGTTPAAGASTLLVGIAMMLMIAQYIFFLALYIYAGYRAASKFGMDIIEGGAVSAFSYLVTGMFSMIVGLLVMVAFGSGSTALAAITAVMMAVSIGVGILTIIVGVIMNFCFGLLGAFIGKTMAKNKPQG